MGGGGVGWGAVAGADDGVGVVAGSGPGVAVGVWEGGSWLMARRVSLIDPWQLVPG